MNSALVFSAILQIAFCNNFSEFHVCIDDEDCEYIPDAFCKNNLCVFRNNDSLKKNNEVTVAKIGEKCKSDNNCNINNSSCKDGICTCVNGTTNSENKKMCLRLSHGLGDKCEEDVQCFMIVSSSICRNYTCSCDDTMHEETGACFKTSGLGESCNSYEECSKTDFSECLMNKCSCVKRYVAYNNNTCLLVAKGLMSTCSKHIQCTSALGSGAYCSNEFCMCKATFMYKSSINKCVKEMRFGDKCNTDVDCHEKGRPPSRLGCIKGECQCKPYYRNSDGHCKSSTDKIQISLNLFLFILVSKLLL